MEPEHLRFGGGATETMLNPLVAVGMLVAIVVIFASPRKKAITPFLFACFSIPISQVVVLGSLHFPVLRILIIAGLIRRATLGGSSSGGKYPGGFNPVDRMVVLWTVSLLTILSLQWMDSQALIHNLGDFLDALGGYLVVRFFIPDGEAVRRTIKTLGVVCVIQGAFMLNEQITHVNVFRYLEGNSGYVTIRAGKIRSDGVMGAGYAGTLAGGLIPLFLWLCSERKSRMAMYAAIAGATAMVFAANSSTPPLALASSLLGLALWPLRKKMRLVRRGLAATLVGLHLVMHGPVWSLIARVDLTGSSSSYHRYYLVDNCIRHFRDWWLLGFKYYNLWGWDMWDLCNQFVVQALVGGLLALVAYIAIFTRLFGAIGNARKHVEGDRGREWFLWCLGSSLFSVVVAHFGINYPAMMQMGLFTLWAIISTATFEAMQTVEATVEVPSESVPAGVPDPVGHCL